MSRAIRKGIRSGLLLGTGIGHNGWLAVAWCVGLAVLGYFWSTSKFSSTAGR
jgi:ABC-2 type transport system permease protein